MRGRLLHLRPVGGSQPGTGAVLPRLYPPAPHVAGRPPGDRGVVDDSSGGESGAGHLVLLGPRTPGYIDEPSAMPAALVEPLFITNRADLASPAGTVALGDAVAGGIAEYLGRGSTTLIDEPRPSRASLLRSEALLV